MDYDINEQLEIVGRNISSLNSYQQSIFVAVMAAVNSTDQYTRVFFVDGPGGTRKTFLYNITLLAQVLSQSEIALALASSGIAALLLQGGRTVHSRLKVPIATNELFVCNIPKQSALDRLTKTMKLLVLDEACMPNKNVAECVDRSLRDICSCDLPFCGKVVVFGGDFRQILPVVKRGPRAEVVFAFLNRSQLWRQVKVMKLTINMRLQNLSNHDAFEVSEFLILLLKVGEGTQPEDVNQMIHIDDKLVVPGGNISDFVASVYGIIHESYADCDYIGQRIIMCPKNDTCDLINYNVINQLPGEGTTLLSVDSVEGSPSVNFLTEYLNSITPNGMPPHHLLILCNLDPTDGS